MKKILLLVSIVSILKLQAQITYQNTWTIPTYLSKVTFSEYGEKFYAGNAYEDYFEQGSDSIYIFNYDGSIFKAIGLPPNLYYYPFELLTGSNYEFGGTYLPSISDKLFNDDALIEVMAVQYNESDYNHASFYVVNELGNIVYTFPDTTFDEAQIFTYNGGYNIALTCTMCLSKVYSLPGTLPCTACGSGSGITEPGSGTAQGEMKAYPNPFDHTLSIDYNLQTDQTGKLVLTSVDGREVKTMTLSSQVGKLTLNTDGLPSGVIMATLYNSGGQYISSKLVKIE